MTARVVMIVLVVIAAGSAFGVDDQVTRGISLYQQGKTNEAITELKAALDYNPEDPTANMWLGYALMNARRDAEALPYLKTAADLTPNDAALQNNLAVVLQRVGDLKGAVEHYTSAVALSPRDADVQHNLASALEQTGDLSGAIEHMKAAVELDPKKASHLLELAVLQFKSGGAAGAEESLKKCLALDPSNLQVHQWLAYVYDKEGKAAEAAAESGVIKAMDDVGLQPRFILKELVSTWNPPDADVTKAFIAADGDRVHVFTEGRAGYQISLKGLRPAGEIAPLDEAAQNGLLSRGSIYVFRGKVRVWGHDFDSDPEYPLTFKATGSGFVYLCGRGTVAAGDKIEKLGYEDSVEKWLPLMASVSRSEREGAACALGLLAKTPAEKDKAVPALAGALKDKSMSVRRFAAEALAELGDSRGMRPLIDLQGDPGADAWTQSVAQESLGLLKVQAAAAKLPDSIALEVLKAGLEDKWASVRRSAAQSLAKAGDPRGADALKKAIAVEKDPGVKAAMEAALNKVAEGRL